MIDGFFSFQVFIDENGDAEGNYSVVTLLSDTSVSTGMSMQPVGYFRYSNATAGRLELPDFRYFDSNRPIQWVGGTQPVAEPPCGFLGEKYVIKLITRTWAFGVLNSFKN